MKFSSIPSTAFLMALLYSQAHATPATPSVPERRQVKQTVQIVNEILNIFAQVFKGAKLAFPEKINAWDYKANGYLCEVYMETTDGLNCYASVTCNDGKKEYNAGKETWNVCYQGGRQYFTDSRIGEFSITFREKDSSGQGLTGPVLQVKDIDNWMEIPVSNLAHQKWMDEDCAAHAGTKCPDGPYICTNLQYDTSKGRTRNWKCGVPMRGMNFPGLDSNKPTNARDYAPGWCGVHVTQFQKPNPAKDGYRLEAKIFDANQNEIGNSVAAGKTGSKIVFNSKLPMPFVVNSRAVDADPLDFEYGPERWDSNEQAAHHCKMGAYDNGKRDMDCGFRCD